MDNASDIPKSGRLAPKQRESQPSERSDFVAIAAHQLRTPLSAVRWTHQMMLDGEFGEINNQQALLIGQAQENVHRMMDLINDLLRADYLEAKKVQYDQRPFDINLLAKEVFEEMHLFAEEENVA